jgi:hypothetical protein
MVARPDEVRLQILDCRFSAAHKAIFDIEIEIAIVF